MLTKIGEFEKQVNLVESGDMSPNEGINFLKESNLLNDNLGVVCQILSNRIIPQLYSNNVINFIHEIYVYMESIGKGENFCESLVNFLDPYQSAIIGNSNIIDNSLIVQQLLETGNKFFAASVDSSTSENKLKKKIIKKSMFNYDVSKCLKIGKDELKYLIMNKTNKDTIEDIIKKDDVNALKLKIENEEFNPNNEIQLLNIDSDDQENYIRPIDYSAECGSLECFKFLLTFIKPGEDILKDKKSPIIGGNFEIIKILMNHGYSFTDCNSLICAIGYNHIDIIKWIINENPSIFDDESNAIEILQNSIYLFKIEPFSIALEHIKPIVLFSFPYPGDNYSIFYIETLKKLDKNQMDELNIFISNNEFNWFYESWFPVDRIDKCSVYALIMNCLKSRTSKNIIALLNTEPALSESEKKSICKNAGICLQSILSYQMFWDYCELPFYEFRDKVMNNNCLVLTYFTIPNFANRVDSEGNNYLQYLFKNVYPSDMKYRSTTRLDKIVREIATVTDLTHKNNDGETAADLLAERKYAISTLIMQAEYREIDNSFPFQRFDNCTYEFSGKEYILQPFYQCLTCGLVGSLGCCEACVKKCHDGHNIKYMGIHNCFCDCCKTDDFCSDVQPLYFSF